MNRMLIAVAGFVAFLSGVQGAEAFTTQPVSPETMGNRLADPDELADRMSNGQSGGTTFGVPVRRHRVTAQPADLSQARVPYSFRANIGNRVFKAGARPSAAHLLWVRRCIAFCSAITFPEMRKGCLRPSVCGSPLLRPGQARVERRNQVLSWAFSNSPS